MSRSAQLEQLRPDGRNRDRVLAGAVETIQRFRGDVGDPMERAVTFRDLVDKGLANEIRRRGGISASRATDIEPSNPPPPSAQPPKPTGFSATSAIESIILEWDNPTTEYANHAFTEIWRNDSDNLANAVRIATEGGATYSDNVGLEASTRYYWIRHVSNAGIKGAFHDAAGKSATTGKVGNSDLTDALITANKISDKGVTTPKLDDLSVVTSKLSDTAVDNNKLADLAVDAAKLSDGSVESGKIASSAVNNAKLANLSVDTAKLADTAVDNNKLADLAVDAAKLSDSSVESTKIANAAVGNAAIANAAVGNAKIDSAAVNTAEIADAAIQSAKIENAAVGSAAIANLAVTNAKIADLAVDSAKIADLSVDKAKISDLAVDTIKIADRSVTKTHFASESNVVSLDGNSDNGFSKEAVSLTFTATGADLLITASCEGQTFTDSDGNESKLATGVEVVNNSSGNTSFPASNIAFSSTSASANTDHGSGSNTVSFSPNAGISYTIKVKYTWTVQNSPSISSNGATKLSSRLHVTELRK